MDLISNGMLGRIGDRFASEEHQSFMAAVSHATNLYHATRGARGYGRDWDNPEEFLAFLDLAAATSDAARNRATRTLYAKLTQRAAQEMGAAARRTVVAACHIFADPDDVESEQWEPHRRWANSLTPHDTIVTFNYDLVVEYLGRHRAEKGGPDFEVPLPHDAVDIAVASRATLVLKLHGSIDWALDGASVTQIDPETLIRDEGHVAAIAAPGRSKVSMSEEIFRPLWKVAGDRIKSADVIVFVGYGMPASDNRPKRFVMDGIRGRDSTRPLTVRIVLGPDTAATEVRRLEGMLRWALVSQSIVDATKLRSVPVADDLQFPFRMAAIAVEPMWSQDFFAVYNRASIHAWHDFNTTMRNYCQHSS